MSICEPLSYEDRDSHQIDEIMGSNGSTRAMRQSRICEYLGLECTHTRTFLCFPPNIRHRIYSEAGLISDADIDLDWRSGAVEPWPWPSPHGFRLTYSLLLTCRTISAEVSSVLYSLNRFAIRYTRSGSLQPLRNLRPRAVSYLTHLTVHLSVTPCERDQSCCKRCRETVKRGHARGKPLSGLRKRHQAILLEWQRAFRAIATHMTPSRLRLRFVCDVEDSEAAKLAVEPLLSLSTMTLADCEVRLSPKPDPALQDLARQTAARAVGKSVEPVQHQFRCLELPPELRLHILKYTNLATPLCEVEWNPAKGFYVSYSTWRCSWEDCSPGLHHACQFRNCWEITRLDCFCCRYHSAYSAKCNCWSPPTPLFLVCRALRKDALAVFFGGNRFVVTPSKGCNRPTDSTPPRLEVSTFLTTALAPDALGSLRFLEIVFPSFDDAYLQPQDTAYEDWIQTVEQVKDKLNLPGLTLRVYMADHYPTGQDVTPFWNNLTEEQGLNIIATYMRILEPLSKLSGIGRFFVHVSWPFAWTSFGRRCRELDPQGVEQEIVLIEERAERMVMGVGYNSALMGKARQVNSQWLESSLAPLQFM